MQYFCDKTFISPNKMLKNPQILLKYPNSPLTAPLRTTDVYLYDWRLLTAYLPVTSPYAQPKDTTSLHIYLCATHWAHLLASAYNIACI